MPNTILAARCCGVATLAVLASLALVAAPIHTAHSQGARLSLPVTVDNTATNPVPSTVVNPADIAKALGIQDPVTFPLTLTLPIGSDTHFNVPANQRLIIEYASGSCDVTNGNIFELDVVTVPGPTAPGLFYPVNLASSFASTPLMNPPIVYFAHTVKIYADPGSTIVLVGNGTTSNSGQISCSARFSGQLVDVP